MKRKKEVAAIKLSREDCYIGVLSKITRIYIYWGLSSLLHLVTLWYLPKPLRKLAAHLRSPVTLHDRFLKLSRMFAVISRNA